MFYRNDLHHFSLHSLDFVAHAARGVDEDGQGRAVGQRKQGGERRVADRRSNLAHVAPGRL